MSSSLGLRKGTWEVIIFKTKQADGKFLYEWEEMFGKEAGDPKGLLLSISCLVHSQPLSSSLFHHLASSSILPHPHPREDLDSQLHKQYFSGSS